MKLIPLLGAVVLGAMTAPAAFAGDASVFQANPTSNSVNHQNNSGSVTLNPNGGTQVNNNVNNAFSSTYSFGPGISCPTPSIALSTHGGTSSAWSGGYNGTGASSYGATASFIIPLGGSIGTSCEILSSEIANQRVLDTQVNMIRVCSELAKQGVTVDLKDFPQFEVCRSVTVAGRVAVNIETGPVFTEPSSAVTVVPVRKY